MSKTKYMSKTFTVDSQCYVIEVERKQGSQEKQMIIKAGSVCGDEQQQMLIVSESQMPTFVELVDCAYLMMMNNVSPVDTRDIENARPPNVGAKWTPELDQELQKRFERDDAIKELATRFGRTEGGIRSRLKKLGLIQWS